MLQYTDSDKKIAVRLRQASEAETPALLQLVQKEGTVALIPDLVQVLARSKATEVHKAIEKMLGDLREPRAAEPMIEAVRNPQLRAVRKQLLTACWQSRLDFSPFLEDFVELIISAPFGEAFDAYTIIDHTDTQLDKENVAYYNGKLKEALLDTQETQKRYLLTLTIDTLKGKAHTP